MYEYRAQVTRVIDGDTVVAWIDLGFGVAIQQTLRLVGIDAPEMRGGERDRGHAARAHLIDLLDAHAPITVRTQKDRTGKYGRYLATLHGAPAGGEINLNVQMVRDGHAAFYPTT